MILSGIIFVCIAACWWCFMGLCCTLEPKSEKRWLMAELAFAAAAIVAFAALVVSVR